MIRLEFLGIRPISINEAYTPVRGQMLKTSACRKYENMLRLLVVPQLQGDWSINADRAHRFTLEVFMPDLYNKGWPKTAKSRFKRRDASNMVKVTEDIIASVFGVDDCCFLDERAVKRLGPLRTVITIEELDDDEE